VARRWTKEKQQAVEAAILELLSDGVPRTLDEIQASVGYLITDEEALGVFNAHLARGRRRGRKWAWQLARPDQMRRLDEFAHFGETDWLDWLGSWDEGRSPGELLFAVRGPPEKQSRPSPARFWRALGVRPVDRECKIFMTGFACGALAWRRESEN
jgi:hypothetical protein